MDEAKKTTKEVSLEQEERIAKLIGGSRTPRSGGGNFIKGDVLAEDFFIECKCQLTPKESYSVQKSILDKADHERREMRKPFYALAFELGAERDDYFVINSNTLAAFISERKQIAELKAALNKEIAELDRIYKEMGGTTIPQDQASLYYAHRQEKQMFLESLDKIL